MWRSNESLARKRFAITMTILVAASFAVFATNTMVPGAEKEIASLGLAVLIALEFIRRRLAEDDRAPMAVRRGWWLASVAGLVLVMAPLVRDIASFAYATTWHFTALPKVDLAARFVATPLYDLVNSRDRSYTDVVNDGLALLRTQVHPPDRLVVLDFTNPFSFALQQPSPKGDLLIYDSRLVFQQVPADRCFKATMVNAPPRICKSYGDLRQFPYLTTKCRSLKYWDLCPARPSEPDRSSGRLTGLLSSACYWQHRERPRAARF
jgi:hypothetical protein